MSLVEEWREALDQDTLVGALLLDMSKAFDTVNHSILLRKLSRYGVRRAELKWFADYLSDRRQRVCIRGIKSQWCEAKRGVPQGSLLGPLLFILYVNDLPQSVQKSSVKQYADDTTISLSAEDITTLREGLEDDADNVMKWAENNGLKLNTKKTQLLLIGRKKRERELAQVKVLMGKEEVERSKCTKCLGEMLDDGLSWREQVQQVRKKCFIGLAKQTCICMYTCTWRCSRCVHLSGSLVWYMCICATMSPCMC